LSKGYLNARAIIKQLFQMKYPKRQKHVKLHGKKKDYKNKTEKSNTEDTESLINDNKLEIIQKIIPPFLEYTKIKSRGEIYSIGDNLILIEKNGELQIGKLTKIIPTGGNQKYPFWPTIEIQKYF
jgi:hypothetical protein